MRLTLGGVEKLLDSSSSTRDVSRKSNVDCRSTFLRRFAVGEIVSGGDMATLRGDSHTLTFEDLTFETLRSVFAGVRLSRQVSDRRLN